MAPLGHALVSTLLATTTLALSPRLSTSPTPTGTLAPTPASTPPVPHQTNLRILPLGDSITFGYGSSTYSAYRLSLERRLQAAGYAVHFIGGNPYANWSSMPNPQNDGWPGQTIAQIQGDGLSTFGKGADANLVLLHAGTNDALQGADAETMKADLEALVARVFALDGATSIVLARIVNNENATVQSTIASFNGYVPGVVDEFKARGFRIAGADMGVLPADMFVDGTHPNDQGYDVLAGRWYEAIESADQQGIIAEPEGAFVGNPPV